LVVLGAALGDAGWILFGFGCLALALGVLAGLGRYGTRKLGAYQRSGMAAIDTMSGREFEDFLGELFVRKGYRVARLSGRREGSVGLLLDHAGGPTIVQVKRWAATVDHAAVQEVAAAMGQFRATRALVVTSATYSPSAVTYANSCGVTLWNRATLAAELAAVQREQLSTGTRRLVSDVRAGACVCLGLWVSALVALAMTSRRVRRRRTTSRTQREVRPSSR
jgi:restriction system protein